MLVLALLGAVGGFVRALVTGKDVVLLPRSGENNGLKFVNLGFLSHTIIGAFGYIASQGLGADGAIAGLTGYAGPDIIEKLAELRLGKRV